MRYSGDGDDHNISPEEYTVRIGKGEKAVDRILVSFSGQSIAHAFDINSFDSY